MNRVIAVIVTFNRLALLKQCLEAIETQSHKADCVLVVNNASTDGTKAFLDSWASQGAGRAVDHLPTNTGGSGGFTHAIKKAHTEGAEWIWVMDDDSVPAHDCVATMLDSASHIPEIGFIAPLVRWKDGSLCLPNATQADSVHWAERHPLVRIISATFVGLLLHRRAIDAVGLPVPQFFIWYDDIEYTLRISKTLKGYCVPQATVTHMIPENSIPDFSRVNAQNLWKHRYGIRNETAVLFATRRFGLVRTLLLWMQRNREMRNGGVGIVLRLKVLEWGLKGLVFPYQKWIERLR